MTDDRTDADGSGGPPEDGGSRADTMESCPTCSMKIRRSELAVHLAHAHNIGPSSGGKRKGQRGGRDRR